MAVVTHLVRVALVACALVFGAILVRGITQGLEDAVYGPATVASATSPSR